MKALTILQPYASLICLPETDVRHKRVENRTWGTDYRGFLLIHAGRSRNMLRIGTDGRDAEYKLKVAELPFGSALAVGRLVDCVDKRSRVAWPRACEKYPWLATHRHAEGPFCLILENIQILTLPLPCLGAQGLWEVKRTMHIEILKRLGKQNA